MNNNKVIFVASEATRQFIALAKQMIRDGFDVTIAAPKNENFRYLPNRQFIRLYKIGGMLFGIGIFRRFDGVIVAFDKAAEKLAKGKKRVVPFNDDIGIDLSVWNPDAISGNRQTMLLNAYNIPPHSKMILALEPTDKDVKALILAIQGMERRDFIIGLYGRMSKMTARKVSRKIADSHQIIYLGNEQDLPTLMRASFAIMSMSAKTSFYKVGALAMGRTTIFPMGDIKPNIVIKNGNPADALIKALDLPLKARDEFEDGNIRRAQNYDLAKTTAKLKAKIQNV